MEEESVGFFSNSPPPPYISCRNSIHFFLLLCFCKTSLLHFFHVAIWLWRLAVRECIWNQFDSSKQKAMRRGRREVNGSPFLSTVSRHGPQSHKPNYSFANAKLKCGIQSWISLPSLCIVIVELTMKYNVCPTSNSLLMFCQGRDIHPVKLKYMSE